MLSDETAHYNGQHDKAAPRYEEFAVGSQFSCEVTIADHSTPFGSRGTPFPNKKAAKHHAAGLAVAWLREQGLLKEQDASANAQALAVKKEHEENHEHKGAVQTLTGKHRNVKSRYSWLTVYLEICQKLHINPPRYEISFDGLLTSGFVVFDQGKVPEELRGKVVGRVTKVYGRKAARTELANQAIDALVQYMTNQLALAEKAKENAEEMEIA